MKKRIVLSAFVLLALVVILASCKPASNPQGNDVPDDKISIVTTVFPEYDFARAVAGDKATIKLLVRPGAEIHSYEPSPADIIDIQNSDVFIYIGGESDVWVEDILESMDTSNMKILRLMDSVTPVEEEIVAGMEAEPEDEEGAEAEEGPEYDEHIWTSPKNAILMVNAMADAVCEADPDNTDLYRQNAASYVAAIEDVDAEIRQVVDTAKNKIFVFGDRFPFRYFADEYSLEYSAAFNGCSTETECSAATIAYLIDTVRENGLSHVFYIELSNQNIARSIAEQTGTDTLLLHSCQNISRTDFEAGETYVTLMAKNAESLQKGLN